MRHARFWCVDVQDDEMGSVLFWATTRKEALALAEKYIEENPGRARVCLIQKHQCELSSWGFAQWLNRHYTLDNG